MERCRAAQVTSAKRLEIDPLLGPAGRRRPQTLVSLGERHWGRESRATCNHVRDAVSSAPERRDGSRPEEHGVYVHHVRPAHQVAQRPSHRRREVVPPRPLYRKIPDVDAVRGHRLVQRNVELAGPVDVGRGDRDVVTAPRQLARQPHRGDDRPPVTRREAGYDVEYVHFARYGPTAKAIVSRRPGMQNRLRTVCRPCQERLRISLSLAFSASASADRFSASTRADISRSRSAIAASRSATAWACPSIAST